MINIMESLAEGREDVIAWVSLAHRHSYDLLLVPASTTVFILPLLRNHLTSCTAIHTRVSPVYMRSSKNDSLLTLS